MQQQYNEALLQARLETHEATLHHIGIELHENIGQLLSSTKMLLGITERSLDTIPDTLRTAEETLGKAIQDLRSLSKRLSKDALQEFCLTDSLKREINRINTSRTVQAHYFSKAGSLPISSESQLMLFRVIQEIIYNSIRGAQAQNINIRMFIDENGITVSIDDDGRGIKAKLIRKREKGITNMQHRISLLGGTIRWNELRQGTQVLIILPVQQTNS